jgi:hypothetical protein
VSLIRASARFSPAGVRDIFTDRRPPLCRFSDSTYSSRRPRTARFRSRTRLVSQRAPDISPRTASRAGPEPSISALVRFAGASTQNSAYPTHCFLHPHPFSGTRGLVLLPTATPRSYTARLAGHGAQRRSLSSRRPLATSSLSALSLHFTCTYIRPAHSAEQAHPSMRRP